MSAATKDEWKLAPLRPFGDFLLDSKRYLPPTFNDLKRFNNRTTSNLLYYQTNYFAAGAVIFLLFLIFGFNKMLLGVIGIANIGTVFLFIVDRVAYLSSFRAQYPISVFGSGALALLMIYLNLRPMLFVLLALLIPIALSIIHASVRSRGLKNKINNKMEQIGAPVYINTPMGFILSTLGLETKDYEE